MLSRIATRSESVKKLLTFKKCSVLCKTCVTQANVNERVGVAENLPEKVRLPIDPLWSTARPAREIPGPSKWKFSMCFLPGGLYHKRSLMEIHRDLREKYGNVVRIPGQFGRRDVILSFDPDDFEKVFRTEGIWPVREGLDSLEYYRKQMRGDFYDEFGGLVAEQGERWARARRIVSPVMMNPKTVKNYIPAIDGVALEFIDRIKQIRDPGASEMPNDFDMEVHRWAMESIGMIAFDTNLGIINDLERTTSSERTINAIKDFFRYLYEVDFKPSMWKYVSTPKFRKIIRVFDELHDVTLSYINEKKIQMERKKSRGLENREESVLEKLLQVNSKVAHVMLMDTLIGGVDTTSASFISVCFQIAKNSEKQKILREEIKKTLPNKDSPLTKENMKNMPYLRACIKEAHRLTPVLQANFRSAGQDIVLNGYQIPKGTNLAMSSILLLRDDKHYPKASSFIPERWLRDTGSSSECPSAKLAHPFIYLPFGFGPRSCVGRRFAELQIEVLVSRVVRNFHMEWNYPDIVFLPNFINVPTGALKFKFTDVKD